MANLILAITGSYHRNGIISQAVNLLVDELGNKGFQTEHLHLPDCHIEFCSNCRHCTLQPGTAPGPCAIDDDMDILIDKIEQAERLILAAPVNFGAVTAIYKRFLERLIPYAYWPFDKPYPDFRKKQITKKAVLLTATAMPGIMARFTTNAMHSLKFTAKTVGAKPADKVYIGFASGSEHPELTGKNRKRLKQAAARLM